VGTCVIRRCLPRAFWMSCGVMRWVTKKRWGMRLFHALRIVSEYVVAGERIDVRALGGGSMQVLEKVDVGIDLR